MNWFNKIAQAMPLSRALEVFGLPSLPSPEDVKKRYRQLALQHHPDRTNGDQRKMKDINNAFEVLENVRTGGEGFEEQSYTSNSWYQPSRPWGPKPSWQTDPRAPYNEVGRDFGNINFCKKAIYDKTVEQGLPTSRVTLMAFDGSYFRHSFTAFGNEAISDFMGDVLERWNSGGSNSYPTAAVLMQLEDGNLYIIRINGKSMSPTKIDYDEERGVVNDMDLQRRLAKMVVSGG